MNGRPWTAKDDRQIRKMYPDTDTSELAERLGRSIASVYQRAAHLGIKKSARYQARKRELEADRLVRTGRRTRFKRGLKPWNKGTHYTAGGRSAETRFKKGHRPRTWVPIGTEVVDSDGYVKRKVRDDAPPGMSRRNWCFVHVLVWEETHGPVPAGHAVVFKDGDRTNISLENLECISRAELGRRNSIHRFPKDVRQAIQLVGALNRQINRRVKNAERE